MYCSCIIIIPLLLIIIIIIIIIETIEIYKYTHNFNQEDRFRLSKPWLHLFPPHHPLIDHF